MRVQSFIVSGENPVSGVWWWNDSSLTSELLKLTIQLFPHWVVEAMSEEGLAAILILFFSNFKPIHWFISRVSLFSLWLFFLSKHSEKKILILNLNFSGWFISASRIYTVISNWLSGNFHFTFAIQKKGDWFDSVEVAWWVLAIKDWTGGSKEWILPERQYSTNLQTLRLCERNNRVENK